MIQTISKMPTVPARPTKPGDWLQCQSCYQKAFRISKKSVASLYKAASCHSMSGDIAGARSHLLKAIGVNWQYVCVRCQKDPRLKALRADKGWGDIHTQCEARSTAYWGNIHLAERHYQLQNYRTSAEHYEKAFKLVAFTNRSDHYNAACSWALADQKQAALRHLQASVDRGWINLHHMQRDPDLRNLNGEPGWAKVVKQLEARLAPYDQALMAELADVPGR